MAEYTWYNVTTWADRDWKVAQAAYWDECSKLRGWDRHDGPYHHALQNRLRVARADYRHRILSWFWKLVAPIGVGQCVPEEVAELLAEEWDERTATAAGVS